MALDSGIYGGPVLVFGIVGLLGSCDSSNSGGLPADQVPEIIFARIVVDHSSHELVKSTGFSPSLLARSDLEALQGMGLRGTLIECGSDGAFLARKNVMVVVVRDLPTKPLTIPVGAGKVYYVVEKGRVHCLPSVVADSPGSVTLSPDEGQHLVYEYVMQTPDGPVRSLSTVHVSQRQ